MTNRYDVVIPARNEAETAAAAAARGAVGAGRVIVVDDGSTDATAAEARRAGAEVVRSAGNGSKARALATASSARSSRAVRADGCCDCAS